MCRINCLQIVYTEHLARFYSRGSLLGSTFWWELQQTFKGSINLISFSTVIWLEKTAYHNKRTKKIYWENIINSSLLAKPTLSGRLVPLLSGVFLQVLLKTTLGSCLWKDLFSHLSCFYCCCRPRLVLLRLEQVVCLLSRWVFCRHEEYMKSQMQATR